MGDYKTSLARVRGLGVAHRGTRHFWHQRLTALANIPLSIFLLIGLIRNAGDDYGAFILWLSNPLTAVAFILLMVSVLYHMRLGLHSVIEDYLSGALKIVAMISNDFAVISAMIIVLFTFIGLVL